ncbi:MAG: hypothetical protein ABJP34_01740 [Erythrobacter sp.]
MRTACAAICLCAAATGASAQDAKPSLPDLTADAKELGDERKYVVFHKTGISFEAARRDLSACARHSARSQHRSAGDFVPWGEDDKGNVVNYDGGQYGMVGAVMASIIDGPLNRSVRQTIMIRCMTPRGYTRYRAGKDQWQELFEKRDDWIPIAAVIASGPVPPTPEAKP